MIHVLIDSGDGARIERDYCPMENQGLTDDQIPEALIRIFKRARNENIETYERLERLLEGM